ncbi:MAG: phosphomannomutase/phosphoglucomutase, partial [Pseudomonadota bacterium]
MADLRRDLPTTFSSPTMSPFCPDEEKYPVIERLQAKLVEMHQQGGTLGGLKMDTVVTVNGARVILEGGAFALVRASSNEPKLVVVVESAQSDEEMRAVFADLDGVIRTEPSVGDYDQKI